MNTKETMKRGKAERERRCVEQEKRKTLFKQELADASRRSSTRNETTSKN